MMSPIDRVSFLHRLSDRELSLIRRCVEVMEEGVEQELAEIKQTFREINEGDDPGGGLQTTLDHRAAHIYFDIGTVLRSGLLISVYAVVERLLILACRNYTSYWQALEAPDDSFRYADISDARGFLKKKVGVNFPDRSTEWQELTDLQKLRDAFAHRNGRLQEDELDGRLGAYVEHNDHLKLAGYGKVEVRDTYLPNLLDTVERFFGKLAGELPPIDESTGK